MCVICRDGACSHGSLLQLCSPDYDTIMRGASIVNRQLFGNAPRVHSLFVGEYPLFGARGEGRRLPVAGCRCLPNVMKMHASRLIHAPFRNGGFRRSDLIPAEGITRRHRSLVFSKGHVSLAGCK